MTIFYGFSNICYQAGSRSEATKVNSLSIRCATMEHYNDQSLQSLEKLERVSSGSETNAKP